jgi:hypothetical protein
LIEASSFERAHAVLAPFPALRGIAALIGCAHFGTDAAAQLALLQAVVPSDEPLDRGSGEHRIWCHCQMLMHRLASALWLANVGRVDGTAAGSSSEAEAQLRSLVDQLRTSSLLSVALPMLRSIERRELFRRVELLPALSATLREGRDSELQALHTYFALKDAWGMLVADESADEDTLQHHIAEIREASQLLLVVENVLALLHGSSDRLPSEHLLRPHAALRIDRLLELLAESMHRAGGEPSDLQRLTGLMTQCSRTRVIAGAANAVAEALHVDDKARSEAFATFFRLDAEALIAACVRCSLLDRAQDMLEAFSMDSHHIQVILSWKVVGRISASLKLRPATSVSAEQWSEELVGLDVMSKAIVSLEVAVCHATDMSSSFLWLDCSEDALKSSHHMNPVIYKLLRDWLDRMQALQRVVSIDGTDVQLARMLPNGPVTLSSLVCSSLLPSNASELSDQLSLCSRMDAVFHELAAHVAESDGQRILEPATLRDLHRWIATLRAAVAASQVTILLPVCLSARYC